MKKILFYYNDLHPGDHLVFLGRSDPDKVWRIWGFLTASHQQSPKPMAGGFLDMIRTDTGERRRVSVSYLGASARWELVQNGQVRAAKDRFDISHGGVGQGADRPH